MKSNRINIKIYLGLALVLLVACNRPTEVPTTNAAASRNPTEVELNTMQLIQVDLQTGALDSGAVVRRLQVRGQLAIPPNFRETVTSLLEGVVDSVAVIPGQAVRVGQLLLRLRHPAIAELQERWVQRELALVQARQEYERQQQLRQTGAGIERKWQEAQIRLQVAEAEFQLASEKLRLNRIPRPQPPDYRLQNTVELTARTAGVVARLLVHRGDAVTAGQPLLDLIDPRHVHLSLWVPEQEIAQVRVGQHLRYRLAGQTETQRAEIILVGLEVDSTTRSVEVHAHPLGNTPPVLAGAAIEADLELPGGRQLLAPPEALVSFRGHSYVFAAQTPTAQGRSFRLLPVTVLAGQSPDGRRPVQLDEPLQAGEQIVLRGAYHLLAELRRGEAE